MYFTLSLFKFYKTKRVLYLREKCKMRKVLVMSSLFLKPELVFVHRLLRSSRAFENSSWVSTCKEFRETYSIVRTLP